MRELNQEIEKLEFKKQNLLENARHSRFGYKL